MLVYIIDDEPKIRRGLAHVIAAHRPEWPKPATAGDAETALRDPAFQAADLLFLDIQLPGMSGLELLAKVREERGNSVMVVVISGYAEFSFAQQAIQMYVSAYLLKPIVLKKVYEILSMVEDQWKKRQEDRSMKAAVLENLRRLQTRFFTDLFSEGRILSPEELRRELLELWLPDSPFLMCSYCGGASSLAQDQWNARMAALPSVEYDFKLVVSGAVVRLLLGPRKTLELISCRLRHEPPCSELFCSPVYASLTELCRAAAQFRSGPARIAQKSREELPEDQTAYMEQFVLDISGYSLAVQKTIYYIIQNYALPLDLSTVSAHVHLHKNYLSDLFKRETGVNLSNFITDYRLSIAKRQLRDSSAKITVIAKSVGFNDDHYFSQVFSKRVSITPKKYRLLFS